jgi:hypothetical protein
MSSKTREALKDANRTLCRWQADLPVSAWVEVEATLLKIKAALAAPIRNCDIGTPEEQTKRFQKFCSAHNDCYKCDCPCDNNDGGCQLRWAQMPYEEVK